MWLLKKLYVLPSSIKLKRESHGIPDGFRSQACKLKTLYWAGKTDVSCFLGLVHGGLQINWRMSITFIIGIKNLKDKSPFKELTIWFQK